MTKSIEREPRPDLEGPMRGAAVRAMLRPRQVQPGVRASLGPADRHNDAGRIDVVAGGEFLDDRIRLRE